MIVKIVFGDFVSDNNTELKPTRKSTSPFQRDALDATIAELMLTGHNINEIVKLAIKQHPNAGITRDRVLTSFKRLHTDWKDTNREAMNFHINKELERLDVVEEEAWRNYRACGGTLSEEETSELRNNNGDVVQTFTKEKTKDDPNTALKWFDRILKIQLERRKVLKLEATVNINNVLAVKGYSVFNPNHDWPDAKANKLPEPNVIDAEFLSDSN